MTKLVTADTRQSDSSGGQNPIQSKSSKIAPPPDQKGPNTALTASIKTGQANTLGTSVPANTTQPSVPAIIKTTSNSQGKTVVTTMPSNGTRTVLPNIVKTTTNAQGKTVISTVPETTESTVSSVPKASSAGVQQSPINTILPEATSSAAITTTITSFASSYSIRAASLSGTTWTGDQWLV